MSKNKYFGTDGIRGVAGPAPLDPETMVRLGKAIALVLVKHEKHKPRVLIGKDTRLSGYMIETALAAGLTSMGVDVQLCGPIPTPGVAYLTKSMRADAGIVISASHNSYEDNGVKIFAADGFKLADELEQEIESLLEPGKISDSVSGGGVAEPSNIGKAFRIEDAIGRYTVYLKNCFPRELSLEGLKIGLDCAHGAGYVVAPQTFSELGATVVQRGVMPNGRNINAGFGSLYPEIMSLLVIEQNLNFGLSLDGDADRVIMVDEKGVIVDGDLILALCAADLKKRGKLRNDKVVGTIMANLGLEKYLAKLGIELVRAQVGDRYVLEQMKELKCQIGGEQSGHMIFSDYSTTGDGILTALMVSAIMVREGKHLSDLCKGFERFPQKLINIKVASKPSLENLPKVTNLIKQKEQELKNSGRILVRYSGTENKARIMVECDNEDMCIKHAQDIAELIKAEIGGI